MDTAYDNLYEKKLGLHIFSSIPLREFYDKFQHAKEWRVLHTNKKKKKKNDEFPARWRKPIDIFSKRFRRTNVNISRIYPVMKKHRIASECVNLRIFSSLLWIHYLISIYEEERHASLSWNERFLNKNPSTSALFRPQNLITIHNLRPTVAA